jgi:predicted acyltransferase
MKKRLESLDALRGFDLFCLVVLEGFIHKLGDAIDAPWYQPIVEVFSHKSWEGFSPWDLVMPLFMFMAGVTIPFSMEKYRQHTAAEAPSPSPQQRKALWGRLMKRFIVLWVLGMACQGNLLGLDPHRIYLFTNTLQAIAVGYLFSAILFLHTRWKTQIGIAVALLLAFWAAMEFITIGGFGGGNYTPQGNLAEGIDRLVLGRFRDAAYVEDGQVVFAEWYTYTWILSSLNFVVTVLTGVLTGELLKSSLKERKKVLLLLGTGAALVALGWTWGLVHPVIKHIWTGSMVLVSSGYSMLLMALFYWWIDVRGHHRHLTLLKVYGMNSITAYAVSHIISFSSITRSLFHGLEQYIGDYYPVLIHLSNAAILFLILLYMYRKKIFLRA